MRAFCRIAMFVLGGIGVIACGGERASRQSDTAHVIPIVPESEVPPVEVKTWDPAIGKVLALWVSDFPDSVMIVGPDYVEGQYSDSARFDLRPLSGMRVDLFSRSAFLGTAELGAGVYQRSLEGCVSWPTASISAVKAGWNVGLETGRATVIPLDSVEGMSSRDSVHFTAQITRLASSISETQDTTFSSVPFLVARAYRFRTATIDGVIAVVQRTIPSEADPREERVLFVAERPVGSTGEYQVAFVDRAVGGVEAPRSVEVLAAVMLIPAQRPALVIDYLFNDGESVGFVERVAPGKWEATWESAYVGC